ncbi:MAG: SDR family NAD(P)-dependent oxidoreductase [Stomatobaculum sp.]|nr:SDR family NAD(P)-dependent oxidoreductase [Stomatobaculum sp.]
MKKIALVSGASSGMGRCMVIEIADRFPSLDEIWVTARREENLKTLAEEFPGRIRVFPGNLRRQEVIDGIASALKEEEAKVCILVNAAGFGKIGREGDISPAQTSAMIEVNCIALTALTEAVLPYLHQRCRIINFASAAAFLPQPEFAVYAATKAYVLSYSLALGKELASRGVTVTAVCPGPVTDTEFFNIAEEKQAMADYKKTFVVSQERVVRQAVEDAFAGKTVSVCGLPMKAFQAMTKILPWDLILNYYH